MSLSDEIFSMLTHGTELENSFVKMIDITELFCFFDSKRQIST